MKILIVDDSLVAQKSTTNHLNKVFHDIHIITAIDGEEGLLLYQKHRPELIFLDLLMPKIDGQEVLKTIRSKDQETMVVVLTANIQSEVRKEMEQLGILSFINKPFTQEKAKEIALLIQDTIT